MRGVRQDYKKGLAGFSRLSYSRCANAETRNINRKGAKYAKESKVYDFVCEIERSALSFREEKKLKAFFSG